MKYRVKTDGEEGVVALEQFGDDVILRVNGYGLAVLRSEGDKLDCSAQVAKDLGIIVEIGA
jgi:hypothetical protein